LISPKLTPAQRKVIDAYVVERRDFGNWRPAANPFAARLADLQKQVTEMTDKVPADEEVLLVGYRFTVPIGMKRIRRTIVKLPALFKRLGQAWVLKHCIPSLGDLDKALEPAERAKFIEESRDLSRIIGEPVASSALSIAA
jgi:hypothetical protein